MREPVVSSGLSEKIGQAWSSIGPDIVHTPLERSPSLSRLTGAEVFLKWESEQKTGSFKFRGALNKLRSLSAAEKERGVISASTGNHGLGISLAASMEGVRLSLVLPESVSAEKMRRLKEHPVEIIRFWGSCEKAEMQARRLAGDTGRLYISPYNDIDIIAGQGTIGREVMEDLRGAEAVIVPIGGGGLIAGIAGWIKAVGSGVRVIGVEPAHSAFMAASFAAGRIVEIEEKETIAEAVAGGIEPGSVTFPLCRELVDDIVLVEEAQVKAAMSILWTEHRRLVEGAGALSLAALLQKRKLLRGKRAVLIISGANIAPSAFQEAIS
jgi:threonine dehydratase